ncbi:MAG TPA: gluconate 2-dehydrogenase subunit 3 family protein [Terriglobales bacterium]|nr:gluconate 2-dehydrogenase subunit 3 family protein [Terriglobales bacterium]
MDRREALKLLAANAALPLFSRDALALFQQVHEEFTETAAMKTLDPHQNAMVTAISEIIIPQTNTPGAKAARVNEFIDVILSEWYEEADKASFLAGLSEVDTRCRTLFGQNFVDCAEAQQRQFLETLDSEASASEEHPARSWAEDPPQPRKFLSKIKQLTLVGYYTSEVGFEEELHGEIIPARHAGCAPLAEEAAN